MPPGVVVPWIDGLGTVSALKVRFLDDQGKAKRFGQKAGSSATLFGLHLLPKESRLLVAAEGEMNAMSVWQAFDGKAAVMSVGPEGNSSGVALLARLVRVLKPRSTVLWFDSPEQSKKAGESIPEAVLMQSPYGLDANDVLRQYGSAKLAELIGSAANDSIPIPYSLESGIESSAPVPDCRSECLTDLDGYDPFAEDGSPSRSPDRLLARLTNLGCELILSEDGSKFKLNKKLRPYMLDDVKAQRDELLRLVKKG